MNQTKTKISEPHSLISYGRTTRYKKWVRERMRELCYFSSIMSTHFSDIELEE